MPSEYDKVEVSSEEKAALETKGETPEVQSEPKGDKVSVDEKSSSDTPKDYLVEVEGEDYSLEDVLEWKKDADNKSKWQDSNTKKAQAISNGSRLLSEIDGNENLKKTITEFFGDNPEKVENMGLNNKYGLHSEAVQSVDQSNPEGIQDNTVNSELSERVENLEKEKLERSIGDRYDELYKDNPDFFKTPADGVEFLDYCETNGLYVNNDIDMDRTFKIWSYDRMHNKNNHDTKLNENRERNVGKVVNNSEVGARKVVVNKRVSGYNDITTADLDAYK